MNRNEKDHVLELAQALAVRTNKETEDIIRIFQEVSEAVPNGRPIIRLEILEKRLGLTEGFFRKALI